MNRSKLIPVAAVLAGMAGGSVAGYFYRDFQTSPALQSLSAALELVTGREARAQAAYESAQGKLAALQDELLAQEEKHKSQLAAARRVRTLAEVSLRAALVESKRKVLVAEAVPIPPPVVIPDDSDDPEAQAVYLSDLKTCCTSWKFVAATRQDAIDGLQFTQGKLMDVNNALVLEVKQEKVYRGTIERERNLWKERHTLADKRVQKLKGSRLKWTLGAIAGAAAGIYFSGR